ncbi:hypothetical protein ACXYMO_04590 [Arenibacterium sp. CAU 1754]
MKHLLAIAVGAAVAVAPASSSAWRALNRHEVFPVSKGVFEVVSLVGSGAQDYWCGAGDYAISQLRVRGNQRIYIWGAIGPSVNRPGKKAVQFSLTPPPNVDLEPRLTMSVKAVGDNMRAAMALQYCYGDDPFDRFPRWN